mgnify:FL=1
MKQYIIYTVFSLLAFSASAQTSIDEVLRQIETNNKELRANAQLVTAQKLQARMENNLPDPSVSYSHLYGNQEGMGFQGEFIASQDFEFPTAYIEGNKLRKAKSVNLDHQFAETRQQILLSAKELCLDLILLNQQKQLLDIRFRNAEELSALYESRLRNGDVSILETNKINLELLNVKTEARLNEAARATKLQELAVLNGGVAIDFRDTDYAVMDMPVSFDQLRAEAISSNAQLQTLKSEQVMAYRQIRMNKAKGLPGFQLGYRMNPASGGQRMNGFLVGITIPLFSNRHNVKQAKAQSLYTDLKMDNLTFTVENELQSQYQQLLALKTSMDEYQKVLSSQNNLALLNKAIQAGQISMIEYFVDVTTYYQSMQNYMQLQNQYQKLMAQLYKYRL